jgi:hypothetical protein
VSSRIATYLRQNVLGLVAIFFAMTGVSFALQANSIKSKHIRDGHVGTAEVADDTTPNALTGTDVAANSLGGADIDEMSLDPQVLQARISDSCPAGEAIRTVAFDGQVTCETDDGTAYTAGDGLKLTGSTLALQDCPDGQILKSNAGDWICGADDDTPSGVAGGDLAGTYPDPTLREAEHLHYIGATGEPGFLNGWGNVTQVSHKAAFYKDREGVVHLFGTVAGGAYGFTSANYIFGLDEAYAPCGKSATGASDISDLVFPAPTNVFVNPPDIGRVGVVDFGSGGPRIRADVGAGALSLDGITWRADGC